MITLYFLVFKFRFPIDGRGHPAAHVLYCSVNPLCLQELYLHILTPVPPAVRVQTQLQ